MPYGFHCYVCYYEGPPVRSTKIDYTFGKGELAVTLIGVECQACPDCYDECVLIPQLGPLFDAVSNGAFSPGCSVEFDDASQKWIRYTPI